LSSSSQILLPYWANFNHKKLFSLRTKFVYVNFIGNDVKTFHRYRV